MIRLNKIAKFMIENKWIILFCILYLSLTLPRLGERIGDWDQGIDIFLTQNILKFGYPKGYDGNFSMAPLNEMKPETYAWTRQPWLYHYILAGFFLLFGQSLFVAKLPSIIFGLLTVILFYKFLLMETKKELLTNLSTFLLLISVPFLLFTKVMRYIPLAIFFTLLSIFFYRKALKERKLRNYIFLSLAAVGLFHSNYLIAGAVLVGIGLDYLILNFDRKRINSFLISAITFLAFSIPWILFMVKEKNHVTLTYLLFNPFLSLFYIFSFFSPFIFLLYLYITTKKSEYKKLILLFALITISFIIFNSFISGAGLVQVRYLVTLLPFFIFFNGVVLVKLYRWKKIVGIAVLLLLITSNLLYLFPNFIARDFLEDNFIGSQKNKEKFIERTTQLNSLSWLYLKEITQEFHDPVINMVGFVTDNSKARTIYAEYPINPNFFYTQKGITPVNNSKNADVLLFENRLNETPKGFTEFSIEGNVWPLQYASGNPSLHRFVDDFSGKIYIYIKNDVLVE